MADLYTIEYEELRGGVGGRFWFPVIETFRAGRVDDPQARANARVEQLSRKVTCRNVVMLGWEAVR